MLNGCVVRGAHNKANGTLAPIPWRNSSRYTRSHTAYFIRLAPLIYCGPAFAAHVLALNQNC